MFTAKMSSHRCGTTRRNGFTLIELMCALSVTGVLSSIALPSFEGQLHKARRTDALVSMVKVQAAQERYRSNNARYGSLVDVGAVSTSSAGHYLLEATNTSAEGYDLAASATGSQARDATCRHLKMRVTGLDVAYASGPDASAANPTDLNRRCWML